MHISKRPCLGKAGNTMSKICCIECIHFVLPKNYEHIVLEEGIGVCSEGRGKYKKGELTTLFNSCAKGEFGLNDYEKLRRKRDGEATERCSR